MHVDRALYHLSLWASWHRRDRGITRGYPARASGNLQSAASQSFDSMCDREDHKSAIHVETIVHDLVAPQQKAIKHWYLGERWVSTVDVHSHLNEALPIVGAQLWKRGVMWP